MAPKTWRKLNGVMCLATQSASDVLESPISRTIIEQTPTKILFPNPDANAREYIEGFGLSEREFKLIKEQLEPGSRQFLIKQGHYSVVCELDLKGFDAELKVISGRASTVEELHRLLARTGDDPQQWLPDFSRTGGVVMKRHRVIVLVLACTFGASGVATRRWPSSTWVRSSQMAQQLLVLQDQLDTARSQLTQAQAQFESLTGSRGMERLLAGATRNYLPPDWAVFERTLRRVETSYAALGAQIEAVIEGNAVLTPEQTAHLVPDQREQLEAARRSAALLQVTSRQALQVSSERFDAPAGSDRRDSDGDGPEGRARPAGAHRGRAGDAAERAHEADGALPGGRGRRTRSGAARARARGREHRLAAPRAGHRPQRLRRLHADEILHRRAFGLLRAACTQDADVARHTVDEYRADAELRREVLPRARTIRARVGRAPIASMRSRPSAWRVADRCAICRPSVSIRTGRVDAWASSPNSTSG